MILNEAYIICTFQHLTSIFRLQTNAIFRNISSLVKAFLELILLLMILYFPDKNGDFPYFHGKTWYEAFVTRVFPHVLFMSRSNFFLFIAFFCLLFFFNLLHLFYCYYYYFFKSN